MIQRFKDFMWRVFIEAQSRPLPKFMVNDDMDIPMPKFWQVMVLPVLIVVLTSLVVLELWTAIVWLTILLLLAVVLFLLTRPVMPSNRGGWDDVDV